ncbi:MAG: DNA-binding beta-propeller fold protein YncE [Planctomycetota bacterium]|jgi:DNA-binding beta-propeller fold protein YncE
MRLFCLVFLAFLASAFGQNTPVNFEPSLVHPIAISPSGQRLFALNSEAGLLRVYSLKNPRSPIAMVDIPVGLAPVSLRARSDDEVWVVDSMSDAVSVVSISRAEVSRVIQVKDDPADVVFAGTPERAYVSVSGDDEIRVFDPVTASLVATIPIPGKEPRALAVDVQNNKVHALIFRSGNRTTLIPEPFAPAPPPPSNTALPLAPTQALIISLDDPMWGGHPLILPDVDLVSIDTATNSIVGFVTGIGTINYDLAVDTATGNLVIAGTDANNIIRFEPNLKSKYVDSTLTFADSTTNGSIKIDLNPQVTPATKQDALSEPVAVVIDTNRRHIWVAAQGSDRIARVSETGEVMQRIDVSDPKSRNDAIKRGPRGLALDATNQVLYVLNRTSHTLSVVDTERGEVWQELPLGFDPMPADWRRGQGLLYDARLSADGTVSCASCHVDAEHDLLSWDLGDPGGEMTPVPAQAPHPSFPSNAFPAFNYHPMKGPMVTQTLRGLSTNAPYHWRGDKENIQAFNGAFESLLGGKRLDTKDMDLLTNFLISISHPGNPHQNLDRSFAASAANGKLAFDNLPAVKFQDGTQLTCAECHAGVDGSGPEIVLPIPLTFIGPPQPTNTPQLRGLFRRGTAPINGTPSKVGFGFAHDGGLPTMRLFLDIPAFSLMPDGQKNDLVSFLMAFDTGTAPIVGHRYLVDSTTANTGALAAEIGLLETRAVAGDADLVFEARIDGRRRNFIFNKITRSYDADPLGLESATVTQLHALAAAARLRGVIIAVPMGEGLSRAFGNLAKRVVNREVKGAGAMSTARLEYVAYSSKDRRLLNFSLLSMPVGSTASLVITSGDGRKTQHPSGRWVNLANMIGFPHVMTANGAIRYARVKIPKILRGTVTAQVQVTAPGGGITYSNALTFKPAPLR